MIFPSRKIGALRNGYDASFLVLEGNPLVDFASTGRIRMMMKDGAFLDRPVGAPTDGVVGD